MDKPEKNIRNAPPDKPLEVEENMTSTIKQKNRGKKRKRHDSDSSTDIEDILPENALEVEKNLQTAAIRNNLDDVSVKRILKKVVTNDHVLALVKIREEEEIALGKEQDPKPKLTRAKAKELMRVSPKSAPWNLELTPIKTIPVKTRPEVEALISKDLPEDEDDDEYQPTHDDVPSDDDQTLESCSDLDSQPATPSTPATPAGPAAPAGSPRVTHDGPFKVPLHGVTTPTRRKLTLVDKEEATIALRTRSKLSLSATSIEHIESSFVPPDDVPMPVDDLWNQFLEQCLNPAETSKHEDDDDADPEYNAAADSDAHDDDEGLETNMLRISKKELNDLVTELFSIMPEDPAAEELAENLANNVLKDNGIPNVPWDGKQEPISDEERETQTEQQKRNSAIRVSIGKSEAVIDIERDGISDKGDNNESLPTVKKTSLLSSKKKKGPTVVNIAVEEQDVEVALPTSEQMPPPLLRVVQSQSKDTRELTVDMDGTVKVLPEQILILKQQMRQHIQLATSNYLQLYVNPTHWKLAPDYKEYLEQLNKMVESNSNSVVNVCNLKPAVELVNTWEATVCEDTNENKKMVEFVQSEAERGRRRFAQSHLYVGNFPELFMKVVANSPVFQYPYLLPAMPYRADRTRKFGYRRSEDELIVLGLDQFWQHVEENPDIYKKPRNYTQGRWGLVATCNLVVKYMLPWLSSKWLQAHLHRVKKDKDNPISKFLANREVAKVEHRLLPYNPKLTLYEQPEYEMPRLWLRYLAKSSKRFRYYYYKRPGTGAAPHGVPVTVGIEEPVKKPLPPHFNKVIVCHRRNVNPKVPEISQDKFDLVAVPKQTGPVLTINPMTPSNRDNIISSGNRMEYELCRTDVIKEEDDDDYMANDDVTNPDLRPKLSAKDDAQVLRTHVTFSNAPQATAVDNAATVSIQPPPISNMFKVVQTSTGMYLMPVTDLQTTNTVDSITTPITSTSVDSHIGNKVPDLSESSVLPESSVSPESAALPEPSNLPKPRLKKTGRIPEGLNHHCECCILLKKICKDKQTHITDFFRPKKREEKPCECSHRKFPKISKRLRMLLYNYKSRSWCEQRRIRSVINSAENIKTIDSGQCAEGGEEYTLEDIEYVTTFNMKLTRRSTLCRNIYLKTRVDKIFSKFDPDVGDPISLTKQICLVFDVELADLYREFIGFLTPEQADRIDRFKDYFVHSCIEELVKRIKAEVQNKERRDVILEQLSALFSDGVSSPCEMCARLLRAVSLYPRLAAHVFSLFPHRVGVREEESYDVESPPKAITHKETQTNQPETIPLKTCQQAASMDTEPEASIIKERLKEADNSDKLVICKETLVVLDYGEDDNSNEDDNNEKQTDTAPEQSKTNNDTMSTVIESDEVKIEEDQLTMDIDESTVDGSIISKSESHDVSESTVMSPLVMSEDEPETEIKSEPPEWSKEEDKYIIQLLVQYVTPEARQDNTIQEIFEKNNVYQIVTDRFPSKSVDDVKVRLMRILDILILSKY